MFHFWEESSVISFRKMYQISLGFQAAAGENKTEDTGRVKKALSVFTIVKVKIQWRANTCLVFRIILDIIFSFFLLSFPTLCANRRRQAGTERAIQVLSARPRGDSDGDDGASALSEFSVHG